MKEVVVQRVFLIVIVALMISATASSAEDAGAAASAEVKKIMELNASSATALLKKDYPSLNAVLADDSSVIAADGMDFSRQALIEELQTGRRIYTSYEISAPTVRIYGNATAVVTGAGTSNGVVRGTPFGSNFRYIKVFVKRGGTWKIAYWLSQAAPG